MFPKELHLKGKECTEEPFLRAVVPQLRRMLSQETLQSDGNDKAQGSQRKQEELGDEDRDCSMVKGAVVLP